MTPPRRRAPSPDSDLRHRKALVGLSSLPRIGPSRLRALLEAGDPPAVLEQLRRSRLAPTPALEQATSPEPLDGLLARWSDAARALDVEARWEDHRSHGVTVLVAGDRHWPFDGDPDPPALLFCLGDVGVLRSGRASVAVVGTRRCSAYGVEVAGRLGEELAAAGVQVVSGLAAGIDGAAHVGALRAGAAPPIGVAATGLDVHYPRHHRQLWRKVAESGVLVAEVPLGTPPTRWRFPARNRLVAGLADATVVVESAAAGGSMHTVDEAVRRDRPVLAVPGPVTSAASVGTNRLLAEGAAPACDAGDVLVAIGLARPPVAAPRDRAAPGSPASVDAAAVLAGLDWQPVTLEQLLLGTGLDLGRLSMAVDELVRDGWVRADGGWLERCR